MEDLISHRCLVFQSATVHQILKAVIFLSLVVVDTKHTSHVHQTLQMC